MKIKDFIKTKESSNSHTKEELSFFIKNLKNFSQNEITKWLKAVKVNGMSHDETTALTMAMAESGTILSWQGFEPLIDKHSTGGIGDKITLILVPLLAAYGINVPKLSGRSLGITGGTIDKLESIPGFNTSFSIEEIKEQIKKIGLAICSASKSLAPADKTLYAIRDVTGTVDSIPLIASSIMSKKIAGGVTNIILDVKFGSGAFMKTIQDAKLLADSMVSIGKNLNRKFKAVISDMNQPLGLAIGNTLEVKEAVEVLSGKKISDINEMVLSLAKEAIRLVDQKADLNLEQKLSNLLYNGTALEKFEQMISAQGGNLKSAFSEDKKAKYIEILKSSCNGYIQRIDALTIGETVHSLGAGRKSVLDKIDYSVGILLYKKQGSYVSKDEPLMEIHAKSSKDAEFAKNKLSSAIIFGQKEPSNLKLVHEIIS